MIGNGLFRKPGSAMMTVAHSEELFFVREWQCYAFDNEGGCYVLSTAYLFNKDLEGPLGPGVQYETGFKYFWFTTVHIPVAWFHIGATENYVFITRRQGYSFEGPTALCLDIETGETLKEDPVATVFENQKLEAITEGKSEMAYFVESAQQYEVRWGGMNITDDVVAKETALRESGNSFQPLPRSVPSSFVQFEDRPLFWTYRGIALYGPEMTQKNYIRNKRQCLVTVYRRPDGQLVAIVPHDPTVVALPLDGDYNLLEGAELEVMGPSEKYCNADDLLAIYPVLPMSSFLVVGTPRISEMLPNEDWVGWDGSGGGGGGGGDDGGGDGGGDFGGGDFGGGDGP